MSLYRRKGSPHWYYRFQIDGREFRGSTRRTARREAEAVERDAKRAARPHPGEIGKAPTLDHGFARFWSEHAAHLRSAADVALFIDRLIRGLGADTPLADLGNDQVAQYVAVRRAEVAPASVNRETEVLRGMHNRARDLWEWPVKPISWRRHRLKEPPGRTRHITPTEAARLLAALPDHIAAIVEFALLTGCRKGEILGLTWERVNLHGRWVEVDGKTGTRRVVLSDRAFVLLANLRRPGPVQLVFAKTNLRRHFERAVREVGLRDFRLHDLRHTHATWLRQACVPIEIVQQSLGHASIRMTMRYAHIGAEEVRDAVQKIGTLSGTVGRKANENKPG